MRSSTVVGTNEKTAVGLFPEIITINARKERMWKRSYPVILENHNNSNNNNSSSSNNGSHNTNTPLIECLQSQNHNTTTIESATLDRQHTTPSQQPLPSTDSNDKLATQWLDTGIECLQ
mmetsp:Transcript_31321/g.52224  ORF Transcript_31321/g.52224 Transcript_31321/m.52224 type:complete len:119 (+) Transcript_31321:984-1340(+)